MRNPIFQIDAFSSVPYAGNPAAVCPLRDWLEDDILQAIAQENNLSETAFFVRNKDDYHIRWFTPVAEVDLCGHATLASAFVIFRYLEKELGEIIFQSKSGELKVFQQEDLICMDFPSQPPVACEAPTDLIKGLGKKPEAILCSEDYLAVYADTADIHDIHPDMNLLKNVDLRGIIATAKGDDCDFVSRFFAPKLGVDEDPVTGSAHCTLTPFWSKQLNKKKLRARQLSQRGGELFLEDLGDRVLISGNAVKYMEGVIEI
ncbi:PhzF family phenazine biosynthesis protein [Thermodesulfobacteriota bacterium]